MNIPIPKGSRKRAGSKKDRQVMAHRRKHSRYRLEGRMEKNKARRAITQKRKGAKKKEKLLRRKLRRV